MANTVKALMIGDVIGQPGLKALFAGLGPLVRSTRADVVIANGENAMGGFGIGKEEADRLFSIGVQVITTGNHVWERPGSAELLASTPRLLRPANYPPGAAGAGTALLESGGVRSVSPNGVLGDPTGASAAEGRAFLAAAADDLARHVAAVRSGVSA